MENVQDPYPPGTYKIDDTYHTKELHDKYQDIPNSMMNMVRDVLIFSIAGVLLGITVDYIFPMPKVEDSGLRSAFWLLTQLLFGAIVIFIVSFVYNSLFDRDPDYYLGLTVFVLVYFMFQTQLYVRVSYIWYEITGHQLVRYIDFESKGQKTITVHPKNLA